MWVLSFYGSKSVSWTRRPLCRGRQNLAVTVSCRVVPGTHNPWRGGATNVIETRNDIDVNKIVIDVILCSTTI
jgi:hypothetical protein